jgi:ABC-type Fe3+ transport system permease subunit
VSLTVPCGLSLARAVVAAGVCTPVGEALRRCFLATGRRAGPGIWLLVLAPFLAPALLTGYAYSNFSLSLIGRPGWNEALYNLLLWLRMAPVAAVVLYLTPDPFCAEATHCRRLLKARRGAARSTVPMGPARRRTVLRHVPAAAAVLLLAFAEFELASLLGIRTWTTVLFDAHAGGLPAGASLALAWIPLLVQMCTLAAAALLLWRMRPVATGDRRSPRLPGRLAAWAYLVFACTVTLVVPGAIVLAGAPRGMAALARNPVILGDVAASLLFACSSAVCAYVWCAVVLARLPGRRLSAGRLAVALMLAAPGLAGALVLSLAVVSAFQSNLLQPLYNTPVPLVLALTALLVPLGLMVRVGLDSSRPAASVHAAGLLTDSSHAGIRSAGRRLLWHLQTRRRMLALFLLFCWAYFDLTASSILAPAGMSPVSARLYNQMHYGRNAVLSAMVVVTLAVPVVFVLAAEGAEAASARLVRHG